MLKFFVEDYLKTQAQYIEKCKDILSFNYEKMPKTFFVHSYGCQGNVSEGEKIKGILKEIGLKEEEVLKKADIIILNSCAIRQKAQDKVFSHLGEILKLKQKQKEKIIGVCGCMVQQNHVKEKLKNNFSSVDLIFGPFVIHKLPQLLYLNLQNKKQQIDISEKEIIVENIPVKRKDKIKALVPISYGCNNFCSYCIVPYVKGREKSRDFNVILNEVENLVKKNYKEITLLGQNVNSYGLDLKLKDGFSKLLFAINSIKGDFKVRFMTSHPKDFTKELVDVIANCSKVCKNFHLPVQSGSDRILKQMNRKYSVKEYLKKIEYVKKTIPKATFSTDIIVGFPGEEYEDFKKTLELVKNVEYISIFNFIYSKRKGTKAYDMQDFVSKEEKTKWLEELIKTQQKISSKLNQNYVNQKKTVLFESVFKTNNTKMIGRTDENLLVCCEKDMEKIGVFCNVLIKKANRTFLEGKII